ncbi:fibronectin type III domain-containing protein [Hespellia stercorisuis]|uniref:Probable pectate lyase C n=1 Tax=Hespellia stercorisuis DSM 15480 TaxID=1121950 RepID=A0A1M6W3N2_9FIRM|nr:fibronectin type III domain-containing protein [Hespellia stercorisuis]SHK88289.1 Right handed beta helix region [Hespellia stercorisuis DSM 15480]
MKKMRRGIALLFALMLACNTSLLVLAEESSSGELPLEENDLIITSISAETFPDDNFRKWILTYTDANEDGNLSQEELDNTTTMDVSNLGIADLQGISFFASLTSLNCSGNQLSTLDNFISDLSELKTINCSNNYLTRIDLSKNENIEEASLNPQEVDGKRYSGWNSSGIYDEFHPLEETVFAGQILKLVEQPFDNWVISQLPQEVLVGDYFTLYMKEQSTSPYITEQLTDSEVYNWTLVPETSDIVSFSTDEEGSGNSIVVHALKTGTVTIKAEVAGHETLCELTVSKEIEKTNEPEEKENSRVLSDAEEDITKAAVTGVKNKTYTGASIMQSTLAVTLEDELLTEGEDYEVSYSANRNPGTAKVVITGKGYYTGTICKTFKIRVATVSGLESASEAETFMNLSWKKRDEVTGYEVRYTSTSDFSESDMNKIKSDKNTLAVTGLKAGKAYYYQVRAYVTVEGKTTYGSFSDTYKAVTATKTPEKPTVKGGICQTTVSWKAVSGASGYEVYRAASADGQYKKVQVTGKSIRSFSDTSVETGKTYYYEVRTYHTGTGHKVYSGLSSYNYCATAPATPSISAITGGKKKIAVTWNPVSGTTKYQLFMSDSKDGTYKSIGVFSSGTTQYTKTGLTEAKTYYFKLRAYRTANGVNVTSRYSQIKYGTTRTATPMLTSATGETAAAVLTWEKVIGADGYIIYGSTSANTGFKAMKDVAGNNAETRVTELEKTKYYFKIRAYRNGQDVRVYSSYSDVKFCEVAEVIHRYTEEVNTFQELIDALADSDVKTIEIRNNLSATQSIHIRRNVVIYGNDNSIVGNTSIKNLLICADGNIELHDIKLSTSSDSLLVYGTNSVVKAYNCDFSKSYGNDGVSGNQNGICYLYNCSAHDNYDEGVSTHGTSYCEVQGGDYYNNGFIVGTRTKGAASSFGGVHLGGGRMGKVIGVHSYNNCTYGIALINFKDLSVADKEVCCNNIVESNGSSGIWCTACRDLILANNTIVNNKGDAIHFGLDPSYIPELTLIKSDGIVTGNTMFKNGNDQVVIDENAKSDALFVNQ